MIKKIINTENKQKLFNNFLSLATLQMLNYLLPIITFPYLVRVLGIENFGLLAFAGAIVAYFAILTDYGFQLSATKDISVNRNNKKKVIEIFSAVMSIKLFLMFCSFLILFFIISSIDSLKKDMLIYIFTFGSIVGQVLLPTWFFQGMEKMKYITIVNIISRVIFTISIFIFIENENDVYFVPLLNSLGAIIAGIISLAFVKKEFNISFKFQKTNILKKYFLEGWHIFMQKFYVNIYTRTNILILGILTNNTVVGYYSIAEKIIDIFRQLFTVISQVFYPHFAQLVKNNPLLAFTQLKKVTSVMLIVSFLSTMILFFSENFIISIITGQDSNNEIIVVLNVLMLGITLIPLFSLLTTTLVSINKSIVLNKIARNSALISLVLSPTLIYFFNGVGLATTIVILQIYIIYNYSIVIYKYYKLNVR